jgi:hypothetical protein
VNGSQRTEFREVLEKLYGGFNMPLSEVRVAAYWEGLAKMSLGQFSATVDHCLGERGPERIPAVPMLWQISKSIRSTAPSAPSEPQPEYPKALLVVNGFFLKYLLKRRVYEEFKGDINLGERRRECLSLAAWLEDWTHAELTSERAEIGRMFNEAMERVKDVA